jgi:hypothetical protein
VSSTKRGGQRSEADDYPTPAWATHRALEAIPGLPPAGFWMDPCAGEGAIIRASQVLLPSIHWTAVELRQGAEAELRATGAEYRIADFLSPSCWPSPVDVVFTNPPFRLALPFIEKSLTIAKVVVMLLRINFLGSNKRAEWLRENMPDVYVLPNRPSFTGKGTDSPEYGWFVWVSGRPSRSGQLRMLNTTSKLIRQRDALLLNAQSIDGSDDADDTADMQPSSGR